tara:strand:- start:3057 stop:3302 length:246 start_codon:yes stop_codon:yes gene_type:complete
MNERIKELAREAQAYADQQWLEAGYPSWENFQEVFAEDYNKKFAELIVRECITVINQPNGVGDDDVIRITKDVEKHFGVEE